MFLLLRKGQFGEKLEKEFAIFLIFALMFLRFKKPISYHSIIDMIIVSFMPLFMIGGMPRRKQGGPDDIPSSTDERLVDVKKDQKTVHRTGVSVRVSRILKTVLSVLLITTLLSCSTAFMRKKNNPRLDRPLSYRPGKDVQEKYKIDKKNWHYRSVNFGDVVYKVE